MSKPRAAQFKHSALDYYELTATNYAEVAAWCNGTVSQIDEDDITYGFSVSMGQWDGTVDTAYPGEFIVKDLYDGRFFSLSAPEFHALCIRVVRPPVTNRLSEGSESSDS